MKIKCWKFVVVLLNLQIKLPVVACTKYGKYGWNNKSQYKQQRLL